MPPPRPLETKTLPAETLPRGRERVSLHARKRAPPTTPRSAPRGDTGGRAGAAGARQPPPPGAGRFQVSGRGARSKTKKSEIYVRILKTGRGSSQ